MTKLGSHTASFYTENYKNVKVHMLPCRSDNYSFVLELENKNAVIIDSSLKEPVLNFLKTQNLNLKAILLTHHHYDHVDGVEEIQKVYDCTIYCSEVDSKRGDFQGKHTIIKETQSLKIENLDFEVLETPGHTKSHLNYYLKEQNLLFCGDTVFSLGCGRVLESFENSYEHFYDSLQKIKKTCNKNTQIYCAHEYTKANLEFLKSQNLVSKELLSDLESHIGDSPKSVPTNFGFELKHNAFLNADSADAFRSLRQAKDRF